MRGVFQKINLAGISLIMMALFAQVAFASSIPAISYVVSNGTQSRHLLFVNNPEEIHAKAGACDIADALSFTSTHCGNSIFRHTTVLGNFRNWWEHTNKTGRVLSYGVRLYNPGPNTASVAVSGVGVNSDSVVRGGDEFVKLFGAAGARSFSIAPGKTAWLVQVTNIPAGKFFVGAVDFRVSGQAVILDNLAYFVEPAPTTQPMGFVDRVMGNVREGLVYKGLSSASEAHARDVNFVFGDADVPGRFKIKYPLYELPSSTRGGICSVHGLPLCTGEVGRFRSESEAQDHWVTHIAPDPADSNPKRKLAVVSDMVSFFIPGLPHGCNPAESDAAQECFEVSHRYRWNAGAQNSLSYPNLGNWAVHYKLSGVLKNTGSRARVVHFGLRADGNSPIAYKASNAKWTQKALKKALPNPSDYYPYGVFEVPAGASVPYTMELVLSGPGAGTLENLVQLVN